MGWEDIVKLKAKSKSDMKKLMQMVNLLRQEFNKRVEAFEEAGEYSYAADRIQADTETTAANIVKKMNPVTARYTLIQELAGYKSFFSSSSSTLEGIRELNREQDIRIFGLNAKGQVKGTLTPDERRAYWALYSEFEKSHGADVERQGSTRIQQAIADYMVMDGTNVNPDSLPHLALLDYLVSEGLATIPDPNKSI